MKPLNRRVNKKKHSKLTLKTHFKDEDQITAQDEIKGVGNVSVRPEDIKMHHN